MNISSQEPRILIFGSGTPDGYPYEDAPWMNAFYNLRTWSEANKN